MYLTLTSQIISLGITAKKIPPVPLEGRKYITIQNVGGVFVYLGNSLVTADTAGTGGFQLLPKAVWSEPYSDAVDVYGVIASGSSEIYIEEGK
jgi:hypothetical protein